MGYRSEVHLGIDEAIVEQLLTFAGVNQECYKLLFEYADATEGAPRRAGDAALQFKGHLRGGW